VAGWELDTRLTDLGDGRYERLLSRDWEIWGPNGGYVAGIALRAAGQRCGRARPANASVHFVGVAGFDEPVLVTTTVVRATRQATSVHVAMEQAGKPILQGLVWGIDDGLPGLEHDHAPCPDVPRWSELPTGAERFAASGRTPTTPYPFWANLEQRPPTWIDDWDDRPEAEPTYVDWIRFVAGGSDDAWIDAGRLLVLVDLGGWPATVRRHTRGGVVAPSIDVSCEFHRIDPTAEWLLLSGRSPFAGGGLVASEQHVWDDRGRLMASGISHLLCRPVPS
jgi:acyl-CoA thioesterase